jgi:hypothetical protein
LPAEKDLGGFGRKALSWLPDKDPVFGDRNSCDALELLVVPRVPDLGDGFTVLRAPQAPAFDKNADEFL